VGHQLTDVDTVQDAASVAVTLSDGDFLRAWQSVTA
jgi:hypothetical protein